MMNFFCRSFGGLRYTAFDSTVSNIKFRFFLLTFIQEPTEEDNFSQNYIREIVQDSILTSRRLSHFERMWPKMLQEIVTKYTKDIMNVDAYCKMSLDKIKATL